jgi:hypothetical protein
VIDKGTQSQEKRARMATEKATAEKAAAKAAAEKATTEAKKCTWATTLTYSSYRLTA